MSLGYRTQPMKVGAPLPEEADIQVPEPGRIRAELVRAQVELMYAIAKHRKAWATMRATASRLELEAIKRGQPGAFLDTERAWTLATGDVKWWANEMTAQAATVQALLALSGDAKPLAGADWQEVTTNGDLAHNTRRFVKGKDPR